MIRLLGDPYKLRNSRYVRTREHRLRQSEVERFRRWALRYWPEAWDLLRRTRMGA